MDEKKRVARQERQAQQNNSNRNNRRRTGGGTMRSTSFQDKQQRNDPSVTNTYFNAGKADGGDHGHVKHSDNPDGTTDYLYARDVEGNEYDV